MPEDAGTQETEGQEQLKGQDQAKSKDGAGSGTGEHYWKRQAEKHQRELEKLQRANMTEAEKARAERDDASKRAEQLESELRETRIRGRFETAAIKAGAVDPEAAFKLADLSKVKDDGAGIDQALADLKKSKPYLFGGQKIATGSAGGASASSTPSNANQAVNDAIRARWRR